MTNKPFVLILGTAQDGGYPQAGCQKKCCQMAWEKPALTKYASCLAIVDPKTNKRWLIDATPDFKFQLAMLNKVQPTKDMVGLAGIFLTHGHIGHFTGLINLEKAVISSKKISVYVMPKMKCFLLNNRPWRDLIIQKNIILKNLVNRKKIHLSQNILIKPFLVPHRSEYSETVGFEIFGPRKNVLYIPDIDKWELWREKIENKITNANLALLDGTFYSADEIPHRNISNVPHPLINESIARFNNLNKNEKDKIRFIHLNHTNPLIYNDRLKQKIKNRGFLLAQQGEKIFI